MNNIGKITQIEGNTAKIKIVRDSACGSNCQSCGGCELKDHFITADIKTDFDFMPSVGDNVIISLDNKTFYTYSALGYGIFIVLLILGAVLGYIRFKTDSASVLGGFLGLTVGFLFLKLMFKNKKSSYKIQKSEK